tara:strand:+ start:232 stop:714 length:483 start_codon:yes stop_codon:yes gene_type:complete
MSAVRHNLVLRAGDVRDLGAVNGLSAAAFDPRFGEAWTPSQCAGMLALPGVWLTIASENDRILGFAMSRSVLDDGELLLLAVDPVGRRHGVGRALLRSVIAEAEMRGSSYIHLEVRAGNPAVALYRGEGFSKIGERRKYYRGNNGEQFDAHTYRRTLSQE